MRNFNTRTRSQRLEINSDTINLRDRTFHCCVGHRIRRIPSLLYTSSGYNLTTFFNGWIVVYHPEFAFCDCLESDHCFWGRLWEIRLQVCPFIVVQNYCRFNGFRSKRTWRIRVPEQQRDVQFGAFNPMFPFGHRIADRRIQKRPMIFKGMGPLRRIRKTRERILCTVFVFVVIVLIVEETVSAEDFPLCAGPIKRRRGFISRMNVCSGYVLNK